MNKLAVGIMDNYAAGVLREALASQIPITVAPMVSTRLWPHPARQPNLDMLTAAGTTFIDIQTGSDQRITPVNRLRLAIEAHV